MKRSTFNQLRDDIYERVGELNDTKGHDYSGDEDAFANFRLGAKRLGLTPVQVWGCYASKHWSAIETFVKDGELKSEPIEGRILDLILYLMLLYGLINDNDD